MGFRIATQPDFIEKVWPIHVSQPRDPSRDTSRLLHRAFFEEHEGGDRVELETFAWVRLFA